MKRLNKILILVLALTIALSAMCISASAANTKAGESGTITFTFANVYGVDGAITADAGITITNVTSNVQDAACVNNKVFIYSAEQTTIQVIVYYTVDANATVGSAFAVNFDGSTYGLNDQVGTIVKDTDYVTVAAQSGSGTIIVPKADTTELEAQIAIAEGLNEIDYTEESWATLQAALSAGKRLLNSFSQTAVNNATAKLKDAIAALVKLDRAALIDAMNKADALFNKNADSKLWKDLHDAVVNGGNLLTSRTQADIDAGVTALLNAIKAVEALLNKAPETVIKEVEVTKIVTETVEVEKVVTEIVEKEVPKEVIKEVPVEVPVEKTNAVWLVLFIISLIINLGLAVLVVLYFIKKKNNQKDNTPLVDYNIEEDDDK